MLCQSLLPQLDVSVPDVKKRRGGERRRERDLEKRSHQLRLARSIKLLDLEMFSGGDHFLWLRFVNGA